MAAVGWRGPAGGVFAVAWGASQFVSLLVAYREQRGISTAVNDGLFGIYAVGLELVSGLRETQRIAEPGELAGLGAIYYTLTYVGFALPVILAGLSAFLWYPALLCCLAALAAGSLDRWIARVQSARHPV